MQCTLCGSRFRSFRPAGRRVRLNAECPRCGALERHRLQWLFLRENTDLFEGSKRVLHVAPEACITRHLARHPGITYVTVDREAPNVRVRGDLTQIPFAADSFDVILCSHVLEHIQDDAAAMDSLYHVLKPGGWAIIQVPLDEAREYTLEDPSITSPADRERLFDQWDHVRVYGRDYPTRLATAGFMVDVDRCAFDMDEATTSRYGLIPEPIHVCRKRTGVE